MGKQRSQTVFREGSTRCAEDGGSRGLQAHESRSQTKRALAPEASNAITQKRKSGASRPAFFYSNVLLPPVPFHQHPSTMAMNPVMLHPYSMGTRRVVVVTRHPDITAAIPPVIAANPYKARTRRRTRMLNNRCRRTDAHIHLRKRGRRKQSESKQCCECNFLHSRETPSALNFYRSPLSLRLFAHFEPESNAKVAPAAHSASLNLGNATTTFSQE